MQFQADAGGMQTDNYCCSSFYSVYLKKEIFLQQKSLSVNNFGGGDGVGRG